MRYGGFIIFPIWRAWRTAKQVIQSNGESLADLLTLTESEFTCDARKFFFANILTSNKPTGGDFDALPACARILFSRYLRDTDPTFFRFRSIFFLTVAVSGTAVITLLHNSSLIESFFFF